MKSFIAFMASTAGRILRTVAGIALIAWGIFGGGGTIMAVVGAVPLLAGSLDFCLLAPLFGCPFNGVKIRAQC